LEQQGISQVDFIKVDVEGFEIEVLNGMRGIIAKSPNLHMLVEYNARALRAGCVAPIDLLTLIESLGFEVRRILPDGSLSKNISDKSETFNVLCCPAR
jgi:hypothetical protein